MTQLESGMSKLPHKEPLPPLQQQSPDLNMQSSHQPVAIEGKEATVHDFLSLGASKSASSTIAVAQNGLQSSIATQDLLQPLQNAALPTSSNVSPAAFVLGSSKPHISSVEYSAGKHPPVAYNLVNGGAEMQPNYRSSDLGYAAKLAHGPYNNKHSQQQQKKKLTWILSEDDEDEDDEFLDHVYSSKKEIGYQKFDHMQQPEGKSMDSKGGLTPRSKHSATEQRRRSKINDRFQMLRTLLPNSDQKRDKASFLLEVIEYIQMLHEKVKKYEAAEHLGPPKALPWDKKSGSKEGIIDVSHGPSPLMYEMKGVADANGYIRYHSSPLRVAGHGNGNTHLESISSRGHASPFAPNRLLQVPTGLSINENNSLISKPTLISFATPPCISTEEPTTPTFFPSSSHLLPDARSMFSQSLHQEEQATMRSGHPHSNEEPEPIAVPHLHQPGKSMAPQMSSSVHDSDYEKLRSPEHGLFMHRDRNGNEDIDEQSRLSPAQDLHQRNIDSTSVECKTDQGRTTYGAQGTSINANAKRLREDCRDEVMANGQGPSAFLGGTVNISSPYSQGLLDSLTQALQSSGVDLARASISVHIDLGNQNGSALTSSTKIAKLNTAMPPLQNKEVSYAHESKHSSKRPKVEIDP